MKPGVRFKLFFILVTLVVGVGVVSGAFLEGRLAQWMEDRIEGELLVQARVARDLLELIRADATRDSMQALAKRVGASTGSRVTVIGSDGRLLGDSGLDRSELASADNHAERPEVMGALAGGYGSARRYSATVHEELLYLAVAYRRVADRGVVRVAMPLSDVDQAVDRLRVVISVAGLVGLILAVFISGVASHMAARPLRTLVRSARGVRKGAGSGRLSMASADDELGRLAGSFNELVDELDHTLERLANERDRLGTILEGMSEAVLALDAEDRVSDANPAALELLGLSEVPLGRGLVEVVRVPALAELMEKLPDERSAFLESELSLPGARQVLARAAPVKSTGGTIVVMLDISAMRRLEEVRRDFVANVSHELRTPVSVIQANAETLLDGALQHPERGPQFLTAIVRSAQRLSRLVSDLLDLSRIEAGSFSMDIQPTTVATAVDRAVESLRGLAARKRLEVGCHVDESLRVLVDGNAFDQVLTNLIANAVNYTPEDGHVDVRARRMDHDGPDQQSVVIDVCDDGLGIEPRHRERIFERFYRIDPGRSREMGGTGLGLAIVKHLVVAMRGEVSVTDAPERGSIFRVVLPAAL